MTDSEAWAYSILAGIVFLGLSLAWLLIAYRKTPIPMAPPCHIRGCKGRVTHSHFPRDDPYDIQYFCPRHTGELLDPNRTYTVEPWKTELSDKAIHELLYSEWHWRRRQETDKRDKQ